MSNNKDHADDELSSEDSKEEHLENKKKNI